MYQCLIQYNFFLKIPALFLEVVHSHIVHICVYSIDVAYRQTDSYSQIFKDRHFKNPSNHDQDLLNVQIYENPENFLNLIFSACKDIKKVLRINFYALYILYISVSHTDMIILRNYKISCCQIIHWCPKVKQNW